MYLLDESKKKCYHSVMENLETTNQRIAKNLIYYRKAANLTQAELAQKINYSDKSVSKWESGNGVPDIYILLKLADLYGITVNDLVGEKSSVLPPKKMSKWRRLVVMLLSSGIVWLVATSVFVLLNLILPGKGEWWLAFLYAVPINAIVITVLSSVWKYKITNFVAVSVLIWTVLACVYTTSRIIMAHLGNDDYGRLWLIFLLGVPLQALETLWCFFRWSPFKGKNGAKKDKDSGTKGAPKA